MTASRLQLPVVDREQRLTEIRREAEERGRVESRGIRPAGAPFPRASVETGYYGIPLLKRPSWTWEIPLYFFVGGAAGVRCAIVGRTGCSIGESKRTAALRDRVAGDVPSARNLVQSARVFAQRQIVGIAHHKSMRMREVSRSVLRASIIGIIYIRLPVPAEIREVLAPGISRLHRESVR